MGEDRADNVLDAVVAVLERHELAGEARVSVPHHPGRRELSVFGLSQAPPAPASGALRDIERLEAVGAVSVGKRERVGIRLSESCVIELGEMLESGSGNAMRTGDLLGGRPVVVDFCDPNATKALHVGHLRNIAIGNAVASILRAGGADVVTQSQVGDVGRSVGEAMAGYERFGGGVGPVERGLKSDHFVGSCYSGYVRATEDVAPPGTLASDPALSREDEERDDLASELIERWRRGDPEAVALWRKIRGWAIEGHEETLARLNIRIDRMLFESEHLAEIEAAGDRLVELGAAEATASGAVLYPTGDPSYPQLVLRRPDGHTTQYLRYLGLWAATRSLMGTGDSVQVMGDEWLSLAKANDTLLGALAGSEAVHPTDCLVHGMVTAGDEVIKSSLTEPWLVDDLLEEIAADPRIEALHEGDPELARRLTATTALGMFIADPPAKRLAVSREALFDPGANPGWAMICASARAWDDRYDGQPDPSTSDRDYRFLIAQSQVHRQLMRRSAAELNPIHLARFHFHLSQWFLRAPCTPRLARAMRTVCSAGFSSLGLAAAHGDLVLQC
jgi:arginyl-tRNA synthetase